ncbi:MAG: arylsulfotransferase family protein [Candidatus Sumerlaeota bacterium]
MARIDKDSRIMWVHSGHFHHAIEMDHTGHLIVNINILPPSIDPGFTIRDDGFARMTIDGEIVEEWSLLKILQENGMAARVLGQGRIVPRDLLHLNDAQPVLEDVGILRQGDFILSIRELSAVLIYRPETDKIVKMQTGPWMRQHDVDVLPDGRISVFNNDVIVKAGGRYTRNRPMSSVGIWNPQTGQYEEPWNAVFEAIEMHTKGGGLARILPNGDVFVEEPLRNRMLRVSPQAVRWEYVNADPEKPDISGAIHWARYFLPEEVNLEWLQ